MIVDKDNAPRWQPAALADVSDGRGRAPFRGARREELRAAMSEPLRHATTCRASSRCTSTRASREVGRWTRRLVLFLRVMAGVSMLKGLYHWSRVTGIGVAPSDLFAYHSIAWQTATVFFAVIDLVAAVGLWLAAAWGAVIWLMSVASMLAVEIFFPQVFGAGLLTGLAGRRAAGDLSVAGLEVGAGAPA